MKANTQKLRIVFSKKLKEIRLLKNISQEDLGSMSGLHRTYIGSIERGERNVSIDNIEKIAKALAVESWELFT